MNAERNIPEVKYRLTETEEMFGHRSLPDICAELHSGCIGSISDMEPEKMRKMAVLINNRIVRWTPCINTFDAIVYAMCVNVVNEFNSYAFTNQEYYRNKELPSSLKKEWFETVPSYQNENELKHYK